MPVDSSTSERRLRSTVPVEGWVMMAAIIGDTTKQRDGHRTTVSRQPAVLRTFNDVPRHGDIHDHARRKTSCAVVTFLRLSLPASAPP